MNTLKVIPSITPMNFKQTEYPRFTSQTVQQPMPPKKNIYAAAGGAGLVIAAGVLLGAAAVKLAPKIKSILKHTNPKTSTERDKYKLIKEDMFSEESIRHDLHRSYFAELTLNNSIPAPNGVLFRGPEGSKTMDIHLNKFVDELKQHNWDIVEVPQLDKNKITGSSTSRDPYLGDYLMMLYDIFNSAADKYKQTGQKTAIVIRNFNKITEPRRNILSVPNHKEHYKLDFTDALLGLTDNLYKRGCTLVTDSPLSASLDPASIRVGRIDIKILLPPLKEDSQNIWEQFLKQNYFEFKHAEKTINTYGYDPCLNGTTWRLQYAIDNFPKEYQESSKLYQELQGTKFYPDKYKELIDNAPPKKPEESWRDVHRRNRVQNNDKK